MFDSAKNTDPDDFQIQTNERENIPMSVEFMRSKSIALQSFSSKDVALENQDEEFELQNEYMEGEEVKKPNDR